MKFADAWEGAQVYGPLFTADANSNMPLFGKQKLSGENVKSQLTPEFYQRIRNCADPVLDLLAPPTNAYREKAGWANIREQQVSHPVRASNLKSAYGASSDLILATAQRDNISQIMLKRAKDGYLFDCMKNKGLVSNDPKLHNAWEWLAGRLAHQNSRISMLNIFVSGAEEAAKDEGMIAFPLDFSYMGIHTVWMKLLG